MSWRLNNRSYVRELSGPTFDSLCNNLAWWVVTRRPQKTTKLQNWGWAFARGWALAWDNTILLHTLTVYPLNELVLKIFNALIN